MARDLRTNAENETTLALLSQQLDAEQLHDLYPGYPFDEHPVVLAEDPDGSGIADADIPARSGETGEQQASGHHTGTQETPDPWWSQEDFEVDELMDTIAAVDALMPSAGEGVGSNSWVVAGEHTDTGMPLLADDPHLSASLPSVWTQNHLHCADLSDESPSDVNGFSDSGLRGVAI